MKTSTIITSLALAWLVLLVGCKKDTFKEFDGVCPIVVATNPANGDSTVPQNQVITATFNEPMNPETFTQTSFLLNGTLPTPGTITYQGYTATFTPAYPLLADVTYTCRITREVKDPWGNAMQEDYIWSFRTDSIRPPLVISTDPGDNASGVAMNKVLEVTFSELMNPSTFNTSTFTLMNGATSVTGTVNATGSAATFTPDVNLLPNTTYTATIGTGVQSAANLGLATDYVWTFTTLVPVAITRPDLRTTSRFGILSGVGISNNAGFSEIHDMDVGISPGVRSSVTGFPPAIIVNGAIYCSDDLVPAGTSAMLVQAKQDLTDAYLFCESANSPAPVTVSGDLGGLTLTPGIYKSTSTLLIQSGDLTLDAQGDANAVWIFQVASALTTVGGAGGDVILTGGAQADNVFWQSGNSVTIGDFTSFNGNVLALTSITLNSGAVVQSRMLARNGSVQMTSTNIINRP